MRGWSTDLAPPQAWENSCNGQVDRDTATAVARDALNQFGETIPGLERSRVRSVDAGIIFSWGETDISDPESELHERFRIGISSQDGYFSIDPGKITCAPLFAEQFLNMIR
jgi:hypothetical protein